MLIPFFYRAHRGVCGGLIITVTSLSKSIERNSRSDLWLHCGETSEVPEETMQFQTKRCRHDNEKDINESLKSKIDYILVYFSYYYYVIYHIYYTNYKFDFIEHKTSK